jgi:ubiquinone/menaquinone biosynthesis C-methylase UbiE
MNDPYYQSRYTWNRDRTVVWKEIVRYLSPYLKGAKTVVDLGAGYCDFINNVSAENRIAVDMSPDFDQFAAEGVRTVQSNVTDLRKIPNSSVDVVFASNLFEHLDDAELALIMAEVKRILTDQGLLMLMQPNYRYAYKTYFDDPTHKKVFSHEALKNFLISHNFDIVLMKPKFLPFSMGSKPSLIPILPLVVRAYIHSPVKPLAGQMLFVARVKI